jgi:phenylacetate-CoA ligase
MRDKGINIDGLLKKQLCTVIREALTYVPYYRDLHLGIDPTKVIAENVMSILTQFPYLDKAKIMENPKYFISSRFKADDLISSTSSGSSGIGIIVYRNLRELHIERAFFNYEWGKAGYRRSSRMIRIGADAVKTEKEYPCEIEGQRLLISPFHIDENWIDTIVKEIEKFGARYIHAYPSSLEMLLRLSGNSALLLDKIKGIFLASERVPESFLQLLYQINPGIKVLFHYGLTERSNSAWGQYQNHKISYICDDIYSHSENFTSQHGYAEIVGTSRWQLVMPLIRYKTQDFGLIENGKIQNLEGRRQEFLVTKQNTNISGFAIDIDEFMWEYVHIWQVVQNEIGRVEFHLIPKSNYTSDIGEKILKVLDKKWGGFFDMKIVLRDNISPTTRGKFQFVVNNMFTSNPSPIG